MQKQKKQTNPKEDLVIYKILVAMVVTLVALLAVRQLNIQYGYLRYTMHIYNGVAVAAIVFAAVAVLAAVAAIVLRARPRARAGLGAVCVICAMFAFSSLVLRLYVFDAAPILYCFWVAAALLYAIFLLYQPEFFQISVLTAVAGGLFYYASRSYEDGMNPLLLSMCLLLSALIVLDFVLTLLAARHHGRLQLFGRPVPIYLCGSPLTLYITCVVWALCTILVLLLGASFAYYCFFAAIVYELVAACYYTVKLR